jgi:hypothetical protein
MSEGVIPKDGSKGQCWAAIRGGNVVQCISMRVPDDVDFDSFRLSATQCLSHLGDVKAGELVRKSGELYFVQRKNHKNRSKKVKTEVDAKPKEFLIYDYIIEK